MKEKLFKFFDSGYALPKVFFGLILAIVAWGMMRPVGTQSELDPDASPVGIKRVQSSRMKSKLEKEDFRAQMLEKEKNLRAKYAHKMQQYDQEDQGHHYSRRAWERQIEREKRYYDRLKDSDSKNPNSIKAHMQKSLTKYEEDLPE